MRSFEELKELHNIKIHIRVNVFLQARHFAVSIKHPTESVVKPFNVIDDTNANPLDKDSNHNILFADEKVRRMDFLCSNEKDKRGGGQRGIMIRKSERQIKRAEMRAGERRRETRSTKSSDSQKTKEFSQFDFPI